MKGEDVAFFDRVVELGPGTRRAGDTVGDPLQGRERRDQGEKEAVTVRKERAARVGGDVEGNLVDLMVGLVDYYGGRVLGGENIPVIV